MSLVLASTAAITAPASVDGLGEVATLNDSTSATFVGYLFKASGFGGAAVRTSMDNRPEAHGAAFGNFYYAHRSFTLEVELRRSGGTVPATTYALADARYNKLCRAFDAMGADGTISFTDTDAVAKQILFRREQPPSDPDEQGHVLLAGVCEDPRIYSVATKSGTPVTNAGNAGSPPTFTFTPSGNGTVILTNTTSGLGSPAVTLTVGSGYLSTGSAVTVDFGARTISQGGSLVPQAEVWPSSLWWEIVPGANTWTRTGTATISVAAALTVRDAWLSA